MYWKVRLLANANKIYEVDVLESTPTSERSTLVGKILSVLGNGK